MLKRFIRWIQGYLIVVIKGYSPERFLNLCRNHNILIWDLQKTNVGYEFHISLKGYMSLRPIVRKTKTLPIIKKRYGLPFYLHKYKKRKFFFVGIILAIVVVYAMSLFIWDIEISGQSTHTEEAMVKFLQNQQVYAGKLKSDVSCQEIEETIRKTYVDIGWVSAEIRGTRLLIKITETNMPKPYVEATDPVHIVAEKDGIITSLVVRTGNALVKVGDVVKKGDIIISGVLEIIGDDQSIIKKNAVVADADVQMKTYYTYKEECSVNYEEKVYTTREKNYYSLNLFGLDIYLMNPFQQYKRYELYDYIVMESNLKLNHNFYLPIKWRSISNKEYRLEEKTYTEEELIAEVKRKLNLYLAELEECGVEIIENQVVATITEAGVSAEGRIIVEEPVHTTREVTQEEMYVAPTPAPIMN